MGNRGGIEWMDGVCARVEFMDGKKDGYITSGTVLHILG